MPRRWNLLLGLLLAAAQSVAAAQPQLTSPPLTYILDYGPKHVNSIEYIETIAKAPPTLLHLGKDVPLTHSWGPIQALGGENQAHGKRRPYGPEDDIRRLSPEELRQRMADLSKLVVDLHRAGVKWVAPYICSMTIGGRPDTRAGFWEFYDHWNEYQAFGLGPRPASDPIQWMQIAPDGSQQLFYKFTGDFYPPYEPNRRYAACLNNPNWRGWLEKVTENVARCGFDGAFVDNAGSLRCYCPCCKEKWRQWITRRYSEHQRQELFGTPEPELGTSKPGLLWAETCRFRNASVTEHLDAIRRAGQRILGRPFLVFPNGGEQRPENVMLAYPEADLIMFERSFGPYGTNPGMVLWNAGGTVEPKFNDNVFENKFVQCLRRKVRPIMLTRPGWEVPKSVREILEMNPDGAALGCAESAAFGGGGGFLVRIDAQCMQVQRKFRQFAESHAALFDGLDSLAQVAVAMFPEQTYFGNRPHFAEVRQATEQLLDGHILFDYVLDHQFTAETLGRYAAVVVPHVSCISDRQAAALRSYLHAGGAALVTGPAPEMDELGRKPAPGPLDDVLEKPGRTEPAVRAVGKGPAATVAALPAQGAPLADWLSKLAGEDLSVIRSAQTPLLAKIRVNAFRHPAGSRYVVHLLNYNVPLGVAPKELERPGPVEVALRLPSAVHAMHARCYDPWGQEADLPITLEGKLLRFTVPDLRVYKIVEIVAVSK